MSRRMILAAGTACLLALALGCEAPTHRDVLEGRVGSPCHLSQRNLTFSEIVDVERPFRHTLVAVGADFVQIRQEDGADRSDTYIPLSQLTVTVYSTE